MRLKEEITETINHIFSIISNEEKQESRGLLSGKGGVCLFYAEFYKQLNDATALHELDSSLSDILENLSDIQYYTFCDGLAGIIWLCTFLEEQDLFAESLKDLFVGHKTAIRECASADLKQNNWDFLHGTSGSLLCLKEDNSFHHAFISHFYTLKGSFIDSFLYPRQTNLGVAHGIAGLLALLNYIRNWSSNEIDTNILSNRIIDVYLNNHHDFMKDGYYFDSFLGMNTKSRLAWCYGDLSLAWILYKSALIRNDKQLMDFSLEIAISTTQRRAIDDTFLKDSCVCHGSSGLMLLYKKFYLHTKIDSFLESSNYWANWTLKQLKEKDYLFYDRYQDSWKQDYSLLNGLSGVGLALLSYISEEERAWDECLLLN